MSSDDILKEVSNTYADIKKQAREYVVKPTCDFLDEAPETLRSFKKNHILNQADFGVRMGLNTTLAGLTFLVSWKMNRNPFYAARNAGIMFLGAGSILIPEVLTQYAAK